MLGGQTRRSAFLPHLPAGQVYGVSGRDSVLRRFHLALLHEATHASLSPVLFLDGAHVLNPYEYAEYNFQAGAEGDYGADRILTCRAMTPFQWGKMLTTELQDHLAFHKPSLVVAAHYDMQLNKDDLQDWEQEDYVASTLRIMRRLAHHHRVPLVLTLDLARWTRTHPTAARLFIEGVGRRRRVEWTPRGWAFYDECDHALIEPPLTGLDAYLEPSRFIEPRPVPLRRPPT